MVGPLTYVDVVVIALAFLSGLLAMYRGLTRELLSILSWIVALGTTLYFVLRHKQIAEDFASQIGAPVAIAQIGIGALIFVVVLVIVHLITVQISDAILDSRVGMIDRMFGFVFGLARGLVIVVVLYMGYEAFHPEPQQQYAFVREAKSTPFLKSTGDSLRNFLISVTPPDLLSPIEDGQQQG